MYRILDRFQPCELMKGSNTFYWSTHCRKDDHYLFIVEKKEKPCDVCNLSTLVFVYTAHKKFLIFLHSFFFLSLFIFHSIVDDLFPHGWCLCTDDSTADGICHCNFTPWMSAGNVCWCTRNIHGLLRIKYNLTPNPYRR